MPDETRNPYADVTAFVSSTYYVVGTGDTIDEVQASGEWVATEDPADVPR